MKINKLNLSTAILLLAALFYSSFAQMTLVPHKISLRDGREFNLNLPADYEIIPAAEGLRRDRFFAVAPDGRIFVTDMFDMSDNSKGSVYILEDWNAKTGKFGKITPFLINLRNPNSVAFYTDKQGQDWFYLAETDKLTRRKYVRNSAAPTTVKEVLATFPRLRFEIQIRKLAYDAHDCFFARRKNVCVRRHELRFMQGKEEGKRRSRRGFGNES